MRVVSLFQKKKRKKCFLSVETSLISIHKSSDKILEDCTWFQQHAGREDGDPRDGWHHELDPGNRRRLTPSSVLGKYALPPLPTVGAIPRTQPWESKVLLKPSGIQDWTPLGPLCKLLRFRRQGVEIYSSCGCPRQARSKFPWLLTLPLTNLEWPASFFSLSLPSVSMEASLWTNTNVSSWLLQECYLAKCKGGPEQAPNQGPMTAFSSPRLWRFDATNVPCCPSGATLHEGYTVDTACWICLHGSPWISIQMPSFICSGKAGWLPAQQHHLLVGETELGQNQPGVDSDG